MNADLLLETDDIECPKCGHKYFALRTVSFKKDGIIVKVTRKCLYLECGYEGKFKVTEAYVLCNKHLRTWRAYNSTEDSHRARLTNNKDK